MPVDSSGRMTCPRYPALACPSRDCPGIDDPGICAHLKRLAAWRALTTADQVERASSSGGSIDPIVRDAVIACPDRGPVLPISEQDDCGCQGREVSLCRAGRGARPGRVTLRDCLDCREDWIRAGAGGLNP